MTERTEDSEIIDTALDTLRWQRQEIDRLTAENERLRAALKGVLPYVATQAIGCYGDKCREPWCFSCNGEEGAEIGATMGLAAKHHARAALGDTQ